ncbi:hypothetical protein N3K66_000408 [Trichothecium roseum]|uniref:Uncharacterized protein n=1 Tax=Trichothecium roseum TaxID=47278 RepID=A0ACC0VBV0_9HYPO|nr:hypothetical protein N3K66_000408 [Trichothecium roseum]
MLRSPISTTTSNSNSASTSTSAHVPEFWRDTVPMLLRQIPSVYYAHLAIHALIDARQTKWAAEEGSSGTDSYNRALRYFGIALAEVQKQTISPRSLQSATLCCLFFIIFEMMNGDERAAQTHFSNGRKMLAELGRSDPSKTTQDTEAIIYRELRMALRFLAVQIQGSREASGTRSGAKSN